jgi:muramoyltetrapeptide carboxypeptidase
VIPFGKTAKEIVFDVCKDYDFPICFEFPAGHVDDNRALIFGRSIQLEVDSRQSKVNISK